ncbi:unnamed protein product [Auanema sp. JU1783]|nr:unnamed protein product [Auanema sp. JU1783]
MTMVRKACDESAVGRARRGRPSKQKKDDNITRTGFDGNTTPPWRKTVSIYKQPVTLVMTTSKDTKRGPTEEKMRKATNKSEFKPFPVLWAKSLQGLSSCSPLSVADKLDLKSVEYTSDHLHIVGKIEKATNVFDEVATAATLFNTLHHPLQPGAFGQKADKEKLETNLCLYINPEQPLVAPITITPEEINSQEKRVLDARKRLQEVIKHFG